MKTVITSILISWIIVLAGACLTPAARECSVAEGHDLRICLPRLEARLQALEEHVTTAPIEVWDEDRSCVTTVTACVWVHWPKGGCR
jgi:hypothetical protein